MRRVDFGMLELEAQLIGFLLKPSRSLHRCVSVAC